MGRRGGQSSEICYFCVWTGVEDELKRGKLRLYTIFLLTHSLLRLLLLPLLTPPIPTCTGCSERLDI